MIKKAMILAAGFGKRVHPLTLNCPKPLLKIGNKPILEHIIIKAKAEGVINFVISIHYLGKNQSQNLKNHLIYLECILQPLQ